LNIFPLDPSILAIRETAETKSLRRQLKTLFEINEILDDGIFDVLLPTTTTRVLQDANCYPSQKSVSTTLASAGLSGVYSVQDVCSKINRLLSVNSIESWMGINEVAWDGFDSAPPAEMGLDHTESLERVLTLLLVHHHPETKAGSIISQCDAEVFAARAKIHDIEPDNFRSLKLPATVNGEITILPNVGNAIDSLVPLRVWENATSARDVKFAIQLQCRKLLFEDGVASTWKKLPPFLIGEGFLESLKTWKAYGAAEYSSTVLNICASVAIRRSNIVIDDFLDASMMACRRRPADNAWAKRVQIFNSHEALRLMLWEKDSKLFEFANIGAKKELYIQVGSIEKAI